MSVLRPFVGAVLTIAALGLLGGCAAASNAGATSSTAGPAASSAPASSAPTSSPPPSTSPPSPGSTAPATTAGPAPSLHPVAPPTAITESSLTSLTAAPTKSLTITTPKPVVGQRMTLVGTVEDGVEASCLILTDEKTGQRYNLTGGDKTIVKLGARVKVVGVIRTDLMSFCQQGRIFQVLEATTA